MTNPTVDEETPLLVQASSPGKAVKRKSLPGLQITILLLILLCEPFTSNTIFPYINQLVAELDITGGDKRKVGYYAGLIESLFFATQATMTLQWGRQSDRIGRKPVLLIGLVGNVLSMFFFGLSRTFWALVISRCLCGLLNGNMGVVKSIIGELTDSTNRADGLSYVSIVWSVGATVAPVIGGSLSRPHEQFSSLFTSEFWREFPYFLPSLAVATFTLVCFLMTLFLFNETLPRRGKQRTSPLSDTPPPGDEKPLTLRQLLTYPVVISVSNYFFFSLLEMAFIALPPLLMSSPVELGGLDCSPAVIGNVLGALGAYIGIVQIAIFPKFVRRFGERRIFIAGVLTYSINCLLFPMTSMLSRKNGATWMAWCLFAFALSLRLVTSMAFSCIFVYINASSPNKNSLGATNGVAQTTVSIARAIGPGLATSLFALSLQKNLLGGYAVYVVIFLLSCISLLFAVHLPSQVWDHWNEND